MGILAPLRRILNDTPGTATDLDYNYQAIEGHVNTELINRDGSIAMTAPLTGVPAVTSDQYTTLGQVAGGVPAGVVWEWGGLVANIPTGWIACDGQAYSSTDPTYEALFNAIGYLWGDAGGGNFNVPNHGGRMTIGPDVGLTEGTVGGWADPIVPLHQHDLTAGGEHTHSIPEQTHDDTGDQDTSHTHPIDHNHASATTSADGDHGHFYSARNNALASGDVGEAMISNSSGTGTTKATLNQPSHTHTLNLPNHTGNSGNQSASHAHTVPAHPATVTGSAGPANTDDAGEDPTGRNYSPYAVAAKMIKL